MPQRGRQLDQLREAARIAPGQLLHAPQPVVDRVGVDVEQLGGAGDVEVAVRVGAQRLGQRRELVDARREQQVRGLVRGRGQVVEERDVLEHDDAAHPLRRG